LTTWLDPTVNVLNAFSATIGGLVGLVSVRRDPPGIRSLILIFGGISTCGRSFLRASESSLSEYSILIFLFPCYCDVLISQAAQAVGASRDALIDLFERMENIFRRLETYTDVPQTAGMTDVIMKVMVEVLRILAIATKEIQTESCE
jgi:hypothetical protein